MTMFVKQSIQGIAGYVLPERKARILLDGNELSFPMPGNIRDSIMRALQSLPLNLYPSIEIIDDLTLAIANHLRIKPANLILGVGSSGLLSIICSSIGEPGDKVLIPYPSFSVYPHYILSSDKQVVEIALDDNYDIDLEQLKSVIEKEQPKLIIVPYPNNPTGNLFSDKALFYLIENYDGVVCFDEVYANYAGKTFLKEIKKHDNLIILRSFSKIGLAACRLGYMAASERLVGEIKKGVFPYSINTISAVAAKIFLKNIEDIHVQIDTVIQERERMLFTLNRLPNIKAYKSNANFILCNFGNKTNDLMQYLYNSCSIAVRDFPKDQRLKNCLRITIGTPEENTFLIEKIYDFYGVDKAT